jgi:hypothetical protein
MGSAMARRHRFQGCASWQRWEAYGENEQEAAGGGGPPGSGALRKCFLATPSPAGLRPLFHMRWAVHS